MLPGGFRSFLQAMPLWLQRKAAGCARRSPSELRLQGQAFVFTEHHESHAASAFFPSPFEAAAILTLDGVGEWATSSLRVRARQSASTCWHEMRFPAFARPALFGIHLLHRLQGQFGRVQADGAGAVRRAAVRRLILDELIDLKDDGSFRLDMTYFNYCQGLTMTNEALRRAVRRSAAQAGIASSPSARWTSPRSVQEVTEEVMLRMARHVHARDRRARTCVWPAASR